MRLVGAGVSDPPAVATADLGVADLEIAATVMVMLVCSDFLGHLPLPPGVAGRQEATVVVGLHGPRLLCARAWRPAAAPAS